MIGSTMSIDVPSSSNDLASCVAPQMLASVEYAFSVLSRYGRSWAIRNSLISLRPPSSADEVVVEPRLVDPQVRVDQQSVAVEALDVVALVRAAVAPDVDAVFVHRPHQQRAGDGAPERGGVEVGATGGADVERTALQRHQSFTHELGAAVDQSCQLGAVLLGPAGTPLRSGSSAWPRSAV